MWSLEGQLGPSDVLAENRMIRFVGGNVPLKQERNAPVICLMRIREVQWNRPGCRPRISGAVNFDVNQTPRTLITIKFVVQ